ncbi:hypothetical protein X975_21662, partial [Stegodyphus mimosarum]
MLHQLKRSIQNMGKQNICCLQNFALVVHWLMQSMYDKVLYLVHRSSKSFIRHVLQFNICILRSHQLFIGI